MRHPCEISLFCTIIWCKTGLFRIRIGRRIQRNFNILRPVVRRADAPAALIGITEIPRLDDEIHILPTAGIQKNSQPLLGIMHDIHMQVGEHAEFQFSVHTDSFSSFFSVSSSVSFSTSS